MGKKIIYHYDCGDGTVVQYDLELISNEVNNTAVTIEYSAHDYNWTEKVRGHIAGSFHDDGDSVSFHLAGEDNYRDIVFRVSYSQVEQLHALIDFYENHCGQAFKNTLRKFKEITDDED